MFAVSVASHEKHDHCARMYSEALLAREKELRTLKSGLVDVPGSSQSKASNLHD